MHFFNFFIVVSCMCCIHLVLILPAIKTSQIIKQQLLHKLFAVIWAQSDQYVCANVFARHLVADVRANILPLLRYVCAKIRARTYA